MRDHFAPDLAALVERLFALRRGAKNRSCAWLMLPPLIHGGGGSGGAFGIKPPVVRSLAQPIRAVAAAAGIGVIDARAPLEHDWRRAFGRTDGAADSAVRGDGVHPLPAGMQMLAEAVWARLAAHRGKPRKTMRRLVQGGRGRKVDE